jgi:hypothetical protein
VCPLAEHLIPVRSLDTDDLRARWLVSNSLLGIVVAGGDRRGGTAGLSDRLL